MADKVKNIDIPEGYVVDDFDDELREMGLTEEQIKKFNEEMEESLERINAEMEDEPITSEQKRLMDIIDSDTATLEEKRAARHALFPEVFDEYGNICLNDGEFFDTIEKNMNEYIEEMRLKGLVI